jgi:hypothetical protein
MTKFRVNTETFEYCTDKYSTPEEAYFDSDNHNDKTVAIFDTLDEAREYLVNVKVSTDIFNNGKSALAAIAYIEEADFELNDDSEWEFISGSDYWDFKCERKRGTMSNEH